MFKVNQYFDGKVVSLAFQQEDGPATVGVMDVGEYEFGTSQQEHIEVISGRMRVKLPGQSDFTEFGKGGTFIVEANQTFQLKVLQQTAYLCAYK